MLSSFLAEKVSGKKGCSFSAKGEVSEENDSRLQFWLNQQEGTVQAEELTVQILHCPTDLSVPHLPGMLDLLLVTRVNLRLGIPDHVFVLGDEAVSRAFKRLCMMPVYVLAARIVPPGIEGTVFALLMSVSNFGGEKSGSWVEIFWFLDSCSFRLPGSSQGFRGSPSASRLFVPCPFRKVSVLFLVRLNRSRPCASWTS
jgi:hypothetical protein